MAIFDTKIIDIEGGITKNPQDHGGLTKYGISQREYPNVDIINLTIGQAFEIFKRDYWDKYQVGRITCQDVANQLFRLIVNTDAEKAIKLIQKAVIRRGQKIIVDGVMVPETLAAINSCNPFSLVESMRVLECMYYLAIVDENLTQEIFFRGWIRRALL